MTKDEALKQALRTEKDSIVAAFLASLRESGWTLAPVGELERLKEVATRVDSEYERGFNAGYAEAQEDESNG